MAERQADVVVIGAGIAGAIVAGECVNAGLDVLMLEAGPQANGRAPLLRLLEQLFRDYRIARGYWHRSRKYKKTDYRSVGNRDYALRHAAIGARGGSTLAWGGDAYRLRPEDMRLRSITGQGIDWPIDYQTLEPYYARAEATLCVAGDHRDEGHPPRSGPFPVAAKSFQARDKPFLDLLANRSWPPLHHNSSLAPDGGAFTCDHLFDDLEANPRFKLLTRCVATRILCSSKSRATAIECWNLANEEPMTIAAETVVVAGGGIETPNLLRLSANKWWPQGLGNHSGHLGRHLISHTGLAIGCRPRGIRLINGAIGPTAATRHFDSEREQARGKYLLLWRPVSTGLLFLNANIEQFPAEANSVTLGSARTRFGTAAPIINLNHDEPHIRRKNEVLEHLDSLAEKIGLDIHFRRDFLLAHPMSTARMSEDARDGVINADLRIHTLDNVYVCGSACFPSGGAVNPTLTIAAMAHRLGSHLANSLVRTPKIVGA